MRAARAIQLPKIPRLRDSLPDGRANALGERRRSVLEDARAKERRRYPNRGERWNFFEANRRLRRREDRGRIRLFALTGRDQGDGAFVLRRTCIGMKARMELRGRRQDEGAKKGRKQTGSDQAPQFFSAAHRGHQLALANHSTQHNFPR